MSIRPSYCTMPTSRGQRNCDRFPSLIGREPWIGKEQPGSGPAPVACGWGMHFGGNSVGARSPWMQGLRAPTEYPSLGFKSSSCASLHTLSTETDTLPACEPEARLPRSGPVPGDGWKTPAQTEADLQRGSLRDREHHQKPQHLIAPVDKQVVFCRWDIDHVCIPQLARTSRIGIPAARRTRSATLPRAHRARPVRPWVHIAIRSM